MATHRFEDMIALQEAHYLPVDVCFVFCGLRNFGFRNQICLAVVSKCNNIANGFDRSSEKDFARFLFILIVTRSKIKLC
jgi:four helix bundle protein